MSGRYRCAAEARERSEPRYGTASHVRRWILLEQPGPWGRDALRESRLPPTVATELPARAAEVNARVILIRRPGGRVEPVRRCFVVRSDQAEMEELFLHDPGDLLDVDLTPLAASEPVGGRPVAEAVHLICTNGRHDACCAEFGRGLMDALEASAVQQAWECSHIGGDRFAGNLVCFPHGLYFGHVAPADGPRVAQLYEEGLIDLAHYRGRSCHPFVVQAAEYFLRSARALDHVDDVVYRAHELMAPDVFRISFSGRGEAAVVVRVESAAASRPLTCQAVTARCPPRYELLGIDGPVSPPPGAAGEPGRSPRG